MRETLGKDHSNIQVLLKGFKGWLLGRGMSHLTIKNYETIVRRFLSSEDEVSLEAIGRFLGKLNVSDRVKANYKSALSRFIEYLIDENMLEKQELVVDEDLLDEFASWLRVLGNSERTIELKRYHARLFLEWLGKEKLRLEDVDVPLARRFLMKMRDERNLTNKSVNDYINSLRSFYDFLVEQKGFLINPFRQIRRLRVPERMPEVPDTEAVKLLLEAALMSEDPIRNVTLIVFIIDTGLRAGEIAHLNWADVNLRDRTVRVRGKGGKETTVRFSHVTARLLSIWKEVAKKRQKAAKYDPLFGFKAYNTLRNIFLELNAIAGLERRVMPHRLRAFHATRAILAGISPWAVKEQMRHSHYQSTERYVRLVMSELKKQYDEKFEKEMLDLAKMLLLKLEMMRRKEEK